MAQDNIQLYGDSNAAIRDEISEELLAAFHLHFATGEADDPADEAMDWGNIIATTAVEHLLCLPGCHAKTSQITQVALQRNSLIC